MARLLPAKVSPVDIRDELLQTLLGQWIECSDLILVVHQRPLRADSESPGVRDVWLARDRTSDQVGGRLGSRPELEARIARNRRVLRGWIKPDVSPVQIPLRWLARSLLALHQGCNDGLLPRLVQSTVHQKNPFPGLAIRSQLFNCSTTPDVVPLSVVEAWVMIEAHWPMPSTVVQ